MNIFWSFILTFWVNVNYQKETQGKLSIIRFQAWFLRWKKLNIYICLVCVYIFKDNEEYLHIVHSPSLRKVIIAIYAIELTTCYPHHWWGTKESLHETRHLNFILRSLFDVSAWLGLFSPTYSTKPQSSCCGCGWSPQQLPLIRSAFLLYFSSVEIAISYLR